MNELQYLQENAVTPAAKNVLTAVTMLIEVASDYQCVITSVGSLDDYTKNPQRESVESVSASGYLDGDGKEDIELRITNFDLTEMLKTEIDFGTWPNRLTFSYDAANSEESVKEMIKRIIPIMDVMPKEEK